MSHAFVHDRIFHIGGAENVFFDLIREQLPSNANNNKPTDVPPVKGVDSSERSEELSGGLGIKIYTLFSNRTQITIDNHTIPIITALPRWINSIFVRGSTSSSMPDLAQGDLIDETPVPDEKPALHKAKVIINIANQIIMNIIISLGNLGIKVLKKILDYRNLIVFYPLLTKLLREKIQEQSPQHITISSFAAVKNILPVGKIIKANVTLYLHSPMQYIRENYDEYVKKLARRQLLIFKPLARKLRKWDSKPRRYDTIYTNSIYTKQTALKYYFGKFSKTPVSPGAIIVKYPQIDAKIITTPVATTTHEYYVYVGRLVKFIRETDLIIQLANEINIPLIIMGTGPDEDWLKDIAGDTITFVGQITDIDHKISIMSKARGLINLTKESCGIGTMEALALGVPVLGYNAGATPEFVDRSSGVLAESKEMEHLIEKFREFHEREWEREKIKEKFLRKI